MIYSLGWIWYLTFMIVTIHNIHLNVEGSISRLCLYVQIVYWFHPKYKSRIGWSKKSKVILSMVECYHHIENELFTISISISDSGLV